MPVIFTKKAPPPPSNPAQDVGVLSLVGLEDPPTASLAAPTRSCLPGGTPYYPQGTKIVMVAPKAARYITQPGDAGTVTRMWKAGGYEGKSPDNDLYQVLLDVERVPGKNVAYVFYNEITLCEK